MEHMRYDLLLADNIAKNGFLKFANRKTLHARIFEYMFHEMKSGLLEGKFLARRPKVFEITVTSQGIIVYTVHKSSRVVKFFKTDQDERKKTQESLKVLEERLESYGLKFEKPKNCDYSHQLTDFCISVNIQN